MVCVGLKVLDNWVGKLTQAVVHRIALLVWSNPWVLYTCVYICTSTSNK